MSCQVKGLTKNNREPYLLTMVLFLIHPDDMLRQGLLAVKVDLETQDRRCKDTNIRVFKSFFGKHPKHVCRVFRDLQLHGLLDVTEFGRAAAFKGFLIANNYMKNYACLDVQGTLFSTTNNLTGQFRWIFIGMMAALKPFKIMLPTQAEWDAVSMLLTVDGTHARTNEPRDPDMRRNPKNYSFKNNFSGLNYQIAVNIWTNQIVYINSGDPASVHDMTAMRDEFIGLMPAGARIIADAGYTGKTEEEKRLFAVCNTFDTQAVKKLKKRARARQESVNKRLKDYHCFKVCFMDGVEKHKLCFAAGMVLVQYAIEDTDAASGEPLMTI